MWAAYIFQTHFFPTMQTSLPLKFFYCSLRQLFQGKSNYLPTSRSKVLLGKQIKSHYTVHTSASHVSILCEIKPIHTLSIYFHLRFVSILSSHLGPDIFNELFPSGRPIKILQRLLSFPYRHYTSGPTPLLHITEEITLQPSTLPPRIVLGKFYTI
jgi:hypothetical protein